MSLNRQAELDGIYSRMAADYGKLNDAQVAFAIKEVGRVRADIAELLSEFVGSDGTVKRQRLSRLLRELDGVEKSLRENGTVALTKSIEDSADYAITGMNAGAQSLIGKPLVSGGIERLNKQTVDYVIRRFGDDGLVLSDRIWGTSGEIRDSISSVIRSGIIRGDNVGSMVRDVRKAYDAETWKIKRLVVTEGNTAYRVASANSVRDSDVADYVKINENGHRHGNHTNHRCYKLAKIDKYGEGNGIYKPTDTEIYMPHPQCSSYITPVILDKYLTGDFGGTEPTTEPVAHEMAQGTKLTSATSNAYKRVVDDYSVLYDRDERGDIVLHEMLKEQGFDGKALLVSETEMDILVKAGWSESFRGVTEKKFTDQFRNGDLYAGFGIYGNGTYVAYGGKKAMTTALDYATADGSVMRMALNPNAKIIDFEDLEKMYNNEWAKKLNAKIKRSSGSKRAELLAEYNLNITKEKSGVILGYDAIRISSEEYYVILNRTAVAVQKTDVIRGGSK